MNFVDFGEPLDARCKVTFIPVSLHGLRLGVSGHGPGLPILAK
jgi:hypothetical protein